MKSSKMLHYILSDLLPRWHLHYVLRRDEAFSDTNTYMKTSKARGHSVLARGQEQQIMHHACKTWQGAVSGPAQNLAGDDAVPPVFGFCLWAEALSNGPKKQFRRGPQGLAGLRMGRSAASAICSGNLSLSKARRQCRARNRTRTGRRSKPEFFLFHLNK